MPFFTSPTPGLPIDIYYIDESPPPSAEPPSHTCLLIPGITCDLSDWSWQVPFLLSKNLRVITPDPRGQGRSSAPLPPPSDGPEGDKKTYYPESLSSDLFALLSHLGVNSNVIVIAHSLGTCTATHLAATHPDLVVGLVLLDPLHCMPSSTCDELFSDPETTMQNLMVQFAGKGLVPTIKSGPEWDWHMTWIQRRGMAQDPSIIAAMTYACWTDKQGLGRKEVAMELSKAIKAKRLTLGNSDYWIQTDKEMGPTVETAVVEGVGHWFHHVKGQEVNQILGDWLQKCGFC
ncbi:Alpha/Beta hydrolase protein [Triangularia verruculosa]|uniref:Alpha/Beta hydrolase protein n=1 Tax=Triangularia verruculosa TaxID=2587418 RepID=A0AAN6X7W7_9PEZI|nr:Alpha/Beta hydrolase protein [Triangularia verruculosa]